MPGHDVHFECLGTGALESWCSMLRAPPSLSSPYAPKHYDLHIIKSQEMLRIQLRRQSTGCRAMTPCTSSDKHGGASPCQTLILGRNQLVIQHICSACKTDAGAAYGELTCEPQVLIHIREPSKRHLPIAVHPRCWRTVLS